MTGDLAERGCDSTDLRDLDFESGIESDKSREKAVETVDAVLGRRMDSCRLGPPRVMLCLRESWETSFSRMDFARVPCSYISW